MASVPNGSIVTYTGTWPAPGQGVFSASPSFGKSPDDYVGSVAKHLTEAGLVLRSSENDGGFLGEVIGTYTKLNVKLVVQVANGTGFGSQDDVASIINNAVYQESGTLPYSWSVPYLQVPGGSQMPTGEPSPPASPGKACAGSKDAAGNFDLGCWLSSLTTNVMWAVGLVGIGLFAAIILISQKDK
jgi:hypothetical protein